MLKEHVVLSLLLVLCLHFSNSQGVKNVFLLIPDGASSDLLWLARWVKGSTMLTIGELICGMLKTHSADSSIADLTPSETTMATCHKSTTRYIGVDINRTPKPSIPELAILQSMATGFVVTCQFPHATPAPFVCHQVNRGDYHKLIKQFVYNLPSLVFWGGEKHIDDNSVEHLLDSQDISRITKAEEFRVLKDFNSDQKAKDFV